jgi:hypothetical protein
VQMHESGVKIYIAQGVATAFKYSVHVFSRQ